MVSKSQEQTKIENSKTWYIQNYQNDTTKFYSKKNRILHWDSAQVVKEGALELIKVPFESIVRGRNPILVKQIEEAKKNPNNPNKVQSKQYFYFRELSPSNYDVLIIQTDHVTRTVIRAANPDEIQKESYIAFYVYSLNSGFILGKSYQNDNEVPTVQACFDLPRS